jgi:hypothetical protein
MATAISIVPDAVYDDTLLCSLLGVSSQTLTRARRLGELRHTRKGQRVLYMGRWVLGWLEADASRPAGMEEEGGAVSPRRRGDQR